MKNIVVVARKELRSYLASPMAYVVTAVFLALSGTFFASYLAATSYSDTSIRGLLDGAQVLILLFAAVLTMRLIAERDQENDTRLRELAEVRLRAKLAEAHVAEQNKELAQGHFRNPKTGRLGRKGERFK